jgi:hypothetical protein
MVYENRTGMFQTGMNSNSRGEGMRSYPGRRFAHPEQMGLELALGTIPTMIWVLPDRVIDLTEW